MFGQIFVVLAMLFFALVVSDVALIFLYREEAQQLSNWIQRTPGAITWWWWCRREKQR